MLTSSVKKEKRMPIPSNLPVNLTTFKERVDAQDFDRNGSAFICHHLIIHAYEPLTTLTCKAAHHVVHTVSFLLGMVVVNPW
jgi:hypothetical protein